MSDQAVSMMDDVVLEDGRLLLAFSGWMDGGDVSTATVEILIQTLDVIELAALHPHPFYIYNFPGSMELSAMFRPHANIEDGLIVDYHTPPSSFWCDSTNNLVLFSGREPNMRWDLFAEGIFKLCKKANIKEIYFVGSVAGLVPHTREPRLYTSASDIETRDRMIALGMNPTTYQGPSSFITYLMTQVAHYDIRMSTVVAEIPAYIEGTNPRSVEAVVRCMSKILDLPIDFSELRKTSESWERRLTEALADRPELAEHIQKLETDYDENVFDTQMGDLKEWLTKQGVRLD